MSAVKASDSGNKIVEVDPIGRRTPRAVVFVAQQRYISCTIARKAP